ncbi:MAG: response regulator transcription factor [Pseudomonadota bacterium]|nr:response regulator transcription factor [Pseudomonadota bacterium]
MPNPAEKNIFVVEDEKDVKNLITLHLKREGLNVDGAENGDAALIKLSTNKFDLIILDWMLPGISGLEICKTVRAHNANPNHEIPILMVTARADTADIVLGIEMGADDYITKPFEIPIFIARVRALLRRVRTIKTKAGQVMELGALRLDIGAHAVTCGQDKIELTLSEFKLLSSLLENRGRVLSRERLIALIQGYGVAVTDRTVDTHVFGLRKKLGACSEIIETIRGIGYRIGT